jgi:hypothetical protein
MPQGWGGAFGTSGFPQGAIPPDIAQQYPGLKSNRNALGVFGNLAYGPQSTGIADIATAQANDPSAGAYQQGTATGGGAYAPGGEGTGLFSSLLNNQIKNQAAQQDLLNQTRQKALSGIATTGMDVANNMAGQQQAQLALDQAQQQQQAQQMKSIGELVNFATSPTGGGANIMQAFGASPGTSPLSGLVSGIGSLFSGPNVGMLAGAGGLGDIGGTAGMGIGDISSIFGSLGAAGGAAGGAASGLGYLADIAPLLAF